MQLVEQHVIDRTDPRYDVIDDLLVEEGIGTLIIGKNDGWKQEVEMGKRNNQNFVQIPHARFISITAKGGAGLVVHPVRMSRTKPTSLLAS